jgi:hypothetical protein
MVTEISAVWGNELFAEIPTPVGALAIGSDKTVPLFGAGSAQPLHSRDGRSPRQIRRVGHLIIALAAGKAEYRKAAVAFERWTARHP